VVGREGLLAAPLLTRLVEARLAQGCLDDARVAASELERIAEAAGRDRVVAAAQLARGRIAAADQAPEAESLIREALNRYASLGLRLDTARARLDLTRVLAATDRAVAADVARRAFSELESLGALREADEAAALMRAIGVKAPSGPRSAGLLTRREVEVLRLLGEGNTNVQIGKRLFISPKTVEHHVARIYRKLDVHSRSQAATYAARLGALGLVGLREVGSSMGTGRYYTARRPFVTCPAPLRSGRRGPPGTCGSSATTLRWSSSGSR